jgi:hypothetical protein
MLRNCGDRKGEKLAPIVGEPLEVVGGDIRTADMGGDNGERGAVGVKVRISVSLLLGALEGDITGVFPDAARIDHRPLDCCDERTGLRTCGACKRQR